EIVFDADLILEVKFLLAEFAHPVNDVPIRERVFHPDGYLIGDMLQQLRVLLRKGLVPQARHHQGTERTAVRNQRQAIGRLESLAQYALRNVGAELLDVAPSDENGLTGGDSVTRRCAFHGHRETLLEQSLTDRQIQSVNLQSLAFRVIQR